MKAQEIKDGKIPKNGKRTRRCIQAMYQPDYIIDYKSGNMYDSYDESDDEEMDANLAKYDATNS